MSVVLTNDFCILPSDIKTTDDPETMILEPLDLTILSIIQMCQKEGSWQPFSYKDLQNSFSGFDLSNIWLDKLVSQNLIIIGDDNLYHITKEFIQKCFKKSPAIKIKV